MVDIPVLELVVCSLDKEPETLLDLCQTILIHSWDTIVDKRASFLARALGFPPYELLATEPAI